jgi:hypothetical protein
MENGNRKVCTKLEAAVKQLVNRSASGDLTATRLLLALVAAAEARAADAANGDTQVSEVDQKVMKGLLARFKKDPGTEEDD